MTTPSSPPTPSPETPQDEAPAPTAEAPSPELEDPDAAQIQLTPWMVGLGIAAIVVGVLTGLVMSQATLIR